MISYRRSSSNYHSVQNSTIHTFAMRRKIIVSQRNIYGTYEKTGEFNASARFSHIVPLSLMKTV